MLIRQWQIKPNVIRVISTPHTLIETEDVIFANTDSSGGDIHIHLPTGLQGKGYRIVNTGSGNKVIVHPHGLDNLYGANESIDLNKAESLDINFDGIEGWY